MPSYILLCRDEEPFAVLNVLRMVGRTHRWKLGCGEELFYLSFYDVFWVVWFYHATRDVPAGPVFIVSI